MIGSSHWLSRQVCAKHYRQTGLIGQLPWSRNLGCFRACWPPSRLDNPQVLRVETEPRLGELTARGDAELPECLPQVVVDGVRAEIELPGDFRIGRTARGQPGHPSFLRREVVATA